MVAGDELLQRGTAAYKAGRKAEARSRFLQALKLDQDNERAWLWLSGAVETAGERRACLEWVLAINPANRMDRQGLEHLAAQGSHPVASSRPEPAPPVRAPSRPAPWGEGIGLYGQPDRRGVFPAQRRGTMETLRPGVRRDRISGVSPSWPWPEWT